jgi:hypothetical protein
MREDGKDPDRGFRAMMTDFVSSWAGKSPSTDDFQQIAEKYLTPLMDLAGNHKLDYFFEQWVHNTDVPTLSSALQVQDLGNGKYRISGTLSQATVPADFHTLVPVYLDFGDDKIQKLGTVSLTGSQTRSMSVDVALPQKPRKVLINARNDVLTR